MTTDKTQRVSEILSSLLELQQNPDCQVDDVAYWFRQNIGKMHYHVNGTFWRTINNTSALSYDVRVIDDAPVMVTNITWQTQKQRSVENELDGLDDIFPDIKITNCQLKEDSVKIELTFDLRAWKNLAPMLLSSNLYFGYVDDDSDEPDSVMYRDRVNLILEHLYPDTTIEFLKTAADLGMVTNDEKVFVNWFNQHRAIRDIVPIQPIDGINLYE